MNRGGGSSGGRHGSAGAAAGACADGVGGGDSSGDGGGVNADGGGAADCHSDAAAGEMMMTVTAMKTVIMLTMAPLSSKLRHPPCNRRPQDIKTPNPSSPKHTKKPRARVFESRSLKPA